MTKYQLEKLKEDLQWDSLENLMIRYDCFIISNTLNIYKPIPVNDFLKIKKELRSKRRIDNIVVGGECEIIRFI